MRAATTALALCLVAALSAASASRALADADPPSDVLLLQNVYYPYHPKVSPQLQAQLDDITARARRAGFPIKVALVASRSDLGAVGQLFGHVASYASLLQREIAYLRPQPTLAVMPNGYGTDATGPQGPTIVNRLPPPRTVDGMARGAITAVEQLAAANGHPLKTNDLGGGRSAHHRTSSPALFLFAPVLLLVLAVAARSLLRRGRPTQPAQDAAGSCDRSDDGG
ncbi:MAG TPA: hypothetical protein VFF79_05225 [Conexibacter sp.]|jgi:hypothetical protein|nr:hypothetical protein [Conexibacter sp.]